MQQQTLYSYYFPLIKLKLVKTIETFFSVELKLLTDEYFF